MTCLLIEKGRIISVCDVESPPAYPIIAHMNFHEGYVKQVLVSLNWATSEEDYDPSQFNC